MKTLLISTFLSITLCISNLYSQDTSYLNYYPFRIGNSWTYLRTQGSTSYRYKNFITDTVIQNGHFYYEYNDNSLKRIDTASGSLVRYYQGSSCQYLQNERLIDSLRANPGDTIKACVWWETKCWGIMNIQFYGINTYEKEFRTFTPGWGDHRQHAFGIGLYRYEFHSSVTIIDQLIGCVINGIVYGDTSLLVGINKISSEIPSDFHLYQNYPNPFNPVTKIKFQIPLLRGVSEGRGVLARLVIYDILGREVATLVYEQLRPGTYEAEWDGTAYPSGIYYYKLFTNGYTETKKMILIK